MEIRAAELHNLALNRLIPKIQAGVQLSLDLRTTEPPDLLASSMFRAALSYANTRLSLESAGVQPESSILEHLLGWIRGGQNEIHTQALAPPDPWHGVGIFYAPTFDFDYRSPTVFTRAISGHLAASGITLPPEVLAACTAIGYEAAMNSEEHGSVSLGQRPAESFRIVAMAVHANLKPTLGTLVTDYAKRHKELFGWPELGWVEMVIVDAGVGIAYPNYFLSAKYRNSAQTNLYADTFEVEKKWLEQTLWSTGFTTKGGWGRILTSQSKPGTGTRAIRQRLTATHGCAIVRAGRCAASWTFLKKSVTSAELQTLPSYNIDEREYPLFLGTAWQVIVPITVQLELGFHV